MVSLATARRYRNEAAVLIYQGLKLSIVENQIVGIKEDENEGGRILFKTLAYEWHQTWSKGVIPAHAKRVLAQLENVFPKFATVPVEELSAMKVLAALKPLENKGVLDCMHRTNTVIGQVLKYGLATGRGKYDCRSALSTVLRPHKPSHFHTIDVKDLPQLLLDIDQRTIDPVIRIALKLLLLTMVRPGELLGAAWSELSMDSKVWIIPASRMKAGREHIVPLSPQAVTLFQQAKGMTDSPWIFPSRYKAGQHVQPRNATRGLTAMGYGGRLTAHGIRGLQKNSTPVILESGG
jgi:integrase